MSDMASEVAMERIKLHLHCIPSH